MKRSENLGFARVDLQRLERQGMPEAVFGEGKRPEHIAKILAALSSEGQLPVVVTRLDAAKAAEVAKSAGEEWTYFETARLGRLGDPLPPSGHGAIAVVCAGTSDLPVAEEAALAAETYGNKVERFYDVGVAGLHRLLDCIDRIKPASAVIAVAGMDGALPSVVGGLVAAPVVAVPTSVGYGASFKGVAALLAMLNSCAAGVGVVNIDNGFGAAVLASRINHS